MGGDWQPLIQSVFIGLLFSFLLAKLISFVTAFKEDNLSISRGSPPTLVQGVRDSSSHRPSSAPARAQQQFESDLDGLDQMVPVDGLPDLSEVGSRLSDDISMMAEKGSAVGPDDIFIDDSDDDWEGVETTELVDAFSAATAFVAATAADKVSLKVPREVQLQLYGLYKIATEGPCSTPPPPAYRMTSRAKWQAWHKLGAMPPEDAMQKYVEIVTELFPTWAGGSEDRDKGKESNVRAAESKEPMGPVFSTFVHEESGNELKMDAIHAFAREGDVDNLAKCIDSGVSVNSNDGEGRCPLHWAVDRGHSGVVQLLIKRNADVNAKDNEGQTPLHYAVVCGRESIAKFLIEHNADAVLKDNDGLSPAGICENNWAWLQKQVSTDS